MTPRAVVGKAIERGLDIIAICDHNSARNAAATRRAARSRDLIVIPGMEIASSEEVHIVGLFETDEQAEEVQDEVYSRLWGENDEDVFGVQVVCNEDDEVEDLDGRLLIGATTLPAEAIVKRIHAAGGLAVAAHVDRSGFSIFGQLGFIPEGLDFDALEVSKRSDFESVRVRYPQSRGFTLITSSDAHYPDDIGVVSTAALMAEPTFDELRKVFAREAGRRVVEAESG